MLCIKTVILYAYIYVKSCTPKFLLNDWRSDILYKKCINMNLYTEWKVYKHELVNKIKSV